MPDEVKHTPLPWSTMHWPGGSEVFGSNGEPVVRTNGGYRPAKEQARVQEDVELIVRAVNAHADLLAACEAMYAELHREYGQGVANGYWPDMKPKLEAWAAAIAKAKGGAA